MLSGHLHAGQICLPLRQARRLTLAHPRARFVAGLYRTPRRHDARLAGDRARPSCRSGFFARPEVTELVLRSPAASPLD